MQQYYTHPHHYQPQSNGLMSAVLAGPSPRLPASTSYYDPSVPAAGSGGSSRIIGSSGGPYSPTGRASSLQRPHSQRSPAASSPTARQPPPIGFGKHDDYYASASPTSRGRLAASSVQLNHLRYTRTSQPQSPLTAHPTSTSHNPYIGGRLVESPQRRTPNRRQPNPYQSTMCRHQTWLEMLLARSPELLTMALPSEVALQSKPFVEMFSAEEAYRKDLCNHEDSAWGVLLSSFQQYVFPLVIRDYDEIIEHSARKRIIREAHKEGYLLYVVEWQRSYEDACRREWERVEAHERGIIEFYLYPQFVRRAWHAHYEGLLRHMVAEDTVASVGVIGGALDGLLMQPTALASNSIGTLIDPADKETDTDLLEKVTLPRCCKTLPKEVAPALLPYAASSLLSAEHVREINKHARTRAFHKEYYNPDVDLVDGPHAEGGEGNNEMVVNGATSGKVPYLVPLPKLGAPLPFATGVGVCVLPPYERLYFAHVLERGMRWPVDELMRASCVLKGDDGFVVHSGAKGHHVDPAHSYGDNPHTNAEIRRRELLRVQLLNASTIQYATIDGACGHSPHHCNEAYHRRLLQTLEHYLYHRVLMPTFVEIGNNIAKKTVIEAEISIRETRITPLETHLRQELYNVWRISQRQLLEGDMTEGVSRAKVANTAADYLQYADAAMGHSLTHHVLPPSPVGREGTISADLSKNRSGSISTPTRPAAAEASFVWRDTSAHLSASQRQLQAITATSKKGLGREEEALPDTSLTSPFGNTNNTTAQNTDRGGLSSSFGATYTSFAGLGDSMRSAGYGRTVLAGGTGISTFGRADEDIVSPPLPYDASVWALGYIPMSAFRSLALFADRRAAESTSTITASPRMPYDTSSPTYVDGVIHTKDAGTAAGNTPAASDIHSEAGERKMIERLANANLHRLWVACHVEPILSRLPADEAALRRRIEVEERQEWFDGFFRDTAMGGERSGLDEYPPTNAERSLSVATTINQLERSSSASPLLLLQTPTDTLITCCQALRLVLETHLEPTHRATMARLEREDRDGISEAWAQLTNAFNDNTLEVYASVFERLEGHAMESRAYLMGVAAEEWQGLRRNFLHVLRMLRAN